jgi:hypothetical protein
MVFCLVLKMKVSAFSGIKIQESNSATNSGDESDFIILNEKYAGLICG